MGKPNTISRRERRGRQKTISRKDVENAEETQKMFVAMGVVFNIGVFVGVPELLQWF
ncbi:MAG: hypothetical protein Q8Q47_02270 [Ignavibacteriaceae bacterium]|nr:hypothetical protein [Ignavibacteriaceae bacterium]